MQVTNKQIVSREKVGKIGDSSIMAIGLMGGLHLVVKIDEKTKKYETLGTGPHRAVARFLAEKREPKIVWTALSKADHVPEEMFQFCLPKYVKLTERFRKAQGL
jgi:hypothetical protein